MLEITKTAPPFSTSTAELSDIAAARNTMTVFIDISKK